MLFVCYCRLTADENKHRILHRTLDYHVNGFMFMYSLMCPLRPLSHSDVQVVYLYFQWVEFLRS